MRTWEVQQSAETIRFDLVEDGVRIGTFLVSPSITATQRSDYLPLFFFNHSRITLGELCEAAEQLPGIDWKNRKIIRERRHGLFVLEVSDDPRVMTTHGLYAISPQDRDEKLAWYRKNFGTTGYRDSLLFARMIMSGRSGRGDDETVQ